MENGNTQDCVLTLNVFNLTIEYPFDKQSFPNPFVITKLVKILSITQFHLSTYYSGRDLNSTEQFHPVLTTDRHCASNLRNFLTFKKAFNRKACSSSFISMTDYFSLQRIPNLRQTTIGENILKQTLYKNCMR